MKALIVLLGLWIAGIGTVSAQPQSRFGNCVPGYIDLTIGGTFFTHVPMECVAMSTVSEQGYYPVNQRVAFGYLGNTFYGTVVGYQWTWKPDNSVVTQYNIAYDGDIGTAFQVHQIAVDTDKVKAT
jgi:hypothetical protein